MSPPERIFQPVWINSKCAFIKIKITVKKRVPICNPDIFAILISGEKCCFLSLK